MEFFYNMLMSIEGFDPFVASWCTGILAVAVPLTVLRAFAYIGKRR